MGWLVLGPGRGIWPIGLVLLRRQGMAAAGGVGRSWRLSVHPSSAAVTSWTGTETGKKSLLFLPFSS